MLGRQLTKYLECMRDKSTGPFMGVGGYMKYYIADTHFGHRNVLKFDNRPFSDVDEMDRAHIMQGACFMATGPWL